MNTSPVSYSHKLISFILLVSMVFGQLAIVSVTPAVAAPATVSSRPVNTKAQKEELIEPSFFRTRVILRQPTDLARIEAMDAIVLDAGAEWAQLLVTAEQLETLARREEAPASLNTSMQPMLSQANAQQRQANADLVENKTVAAEMATLLATVTAEQQAALSVLSSIDDDGDGLTNLEEMWWCTDPLNQDSKGDGILDGQAVDNLIGWANNERFSAPTSGTPFLGWPMVPGDGQFNPNCVDQDEDSVPDMAERWMLGLNTNWESTSGDKFDDGQKLFGITKFPGYGALPRAEDTFITANMPGWVTAPGTHPFVAAYPQIKLEIVPNSTEVKLVTEVTTGEAHGVGASFSYATTQTEGTRV